MTEEEKDLRIKYAKNFNNKHFYKKSTAILSISYLIIFVFYFAVVLLISDASQNMGIDVFYRVLMFLGLLISNLCFGYGLYQTFQEINNRRYRKYMGNPPKIKSKWLNIILSSSLATAIIIFIAKILIKTSFSRVLEYFWNKGEMSYLLFWSVLVCLLGLLFVICFFIDVDALSNRLYAESNLCRSDIANQILDMCEVTCHPKNIEKRINRQNVDIYIDALVTERLLSTQEKGYLINSNMSKDEKEFLEEVRTYKHIENAKEV